MDRKTILDAFNKRMGTQRRLLNQREYNLLDFLLGETEPSDPFSDIPSRRLKCQSCSKLGTCGQRIRRSSGELFRES